MSYSIEKNYVRFDHAEGAEYRMILEDLVDLIGNPKLVKRMNFLVDLRSLPKPPLPEDIKKLVSNLKTLTEHIGPKISFIVKSQAEFGMIRMFGSLMDSHGYEIKIFDNEETATSWLME